MNTIILAAGQLNHRLLPMGTHQSNATLPVNGKPVISWLMEDLLEKGITAATVVLLAENQRLSDLLELCFSRTFELNIVRLERSESIVHSLYAGLQSVDTEQPTRVILADTLVRDAFQLESGDFLYTAPVSVSDIWCVAELNAGGTVLRYEDKQLLQGHQFEAVVGYYQFSDTGLLHQATASVMQQRGLQLSEVLQAYGQQRPMQARRVASWFDFGHIESLIFSRKRLLRARHFNTLEIDPLLNTISKESELDDKLRAELEWYDQLPEELKVLTPRIVKREERGGKLYFEQEYYGYPTLSELYLFADLDLDAWRSILDFLLRIHERFGYYTAPASVRDLQEMYVQKTKERLDRLAAEAPEWARLLEAKTLEVNGIRLDGWAVLQEKVLQHAETLCRLERFTIIHGDYCFSNILYDPASQIARLIDPRGSFGSKGIYGDPRYDLAKLRHSIAGHYDAIVADLFHLEALNEYSYRINTIGNPVRQGLSAWFDRAVERMGYPSDEIAFLEGLLFLSMLPLHKDQPIRQRMMFLRALEIFNQHVFRT